MKKVAIFDYDMSVMGGVERVSYMLANSLIEYYDVCVISTANKDVNIPFNLDNRIHCIKILDKPEERLKNTVFKTRRRLRKVLKENKIDVILSMGTYNGLIAAVNCIGMKIKIIFCDHGAIINQINDKKTTIIRKITSMLSDCTVVLTEKSLYDYIKILKIPKKKLRYIYNPIDDSVYKFVKPYNIDSNKIISVSRISKEKGMDLLVNVASELKRLNQNWVWDVYGDGPEFENIKQMINEKNLSNYVYLKGQENQIYEKYGNYAIYALTSYREGLPMVLLEAKANSLPIVSFDIETGPNEIVLDEKNGFLVEPYNVEKMAQKINLLLKNGEKRIEFSKNSQFEIEKFDKERIISQWKELINHI